MNKTVLMALIGSSSLLFSTSAFAAYRGPEAGPANRPGARPDAAASVRHMPDDTRVVLEGRIVNHRRGDCYTFRDRSGETLLEIRRKAWRGVDADHRTLVRVFGKTDRKGRRTCVEARRIEVAGDRARPVAPDMRPARPEPRR